MRIFAAFVLLFILIESTETFVYSCPEVDYRFINTNLTVDTRYVCLYLEEEYTNGATFDKIYMQDGENVTSFTELIDSCVERTSEEPWTIIGDEGFTTNCGINSDFALIFTSTVPDVIKVTSEALSTVVAKEQIIVSPDSGTSIRKKSCVGAGRVTFSTGAGIREEEACYEMRSWKCSDLPDWIITFDNVFTIVPDDNVELSFEYKIYDWRLDIVVEPSESWVVMTSGRSDNAYQYEFATERTLASISIDVAGPRNFIYGTVSCDNSFDDRYHGFVYLRIYTNATRIPNFITEFGFSQIYDVNFAIEHFLQEDQIWDSQDTFICEYTPGAAMTTTLPPIDEGTETPNTLPPLQPDTTTALPTTPSAISATGTSVTPSSSQSTTSAASDWIAPSMQNPKLSTHLSSSIVLLTQISSSLTKVRVKPRRFHGY